jgi:uncharacterized protein YndB with AHSA1/START domain
MIKIEASVVIDSPIGEVFEYVTDYETHQRWQSGMEEAKITSEGQLGVGSQYSYVIKVLGRKLETAGEITKHDPPNKHSWNATSGPFPFKGEYTFESANGSTVVNVISESDSTGFFKMAEPIALRMIQRQLKTSLENMKELLETKA